MNMNDGLFDLLVGLLVRSGLLLAAAGAVSILLRRRSASTQGFALTMILAGSLVLPAAMAMGPSVEIPMRVLEVAAAWPVSDISALPAAGAGDPASDSTPRAPVQAALQHEADAAVSQVPAGWSSCSCSDYSHCSRPWDCGRTLICIPCKPCC
jgi:hypothetical protein